MAISARRHQEEPRGFGVVLREPAFRLIWSAQVCAQLADKFLMFSLIILAYHVSGGSTPVAITLLAYTVPAIAIGPLAGVFADRHDRKRIMVWTSLGRALLVALIPLASLLPGLRGEYLHLLVITFLFAAVGQLFSPAEAAAIPSVLPKSALISANSMVLATMVVTLVAGGALAPIVSRVDIYLPYWLAAGLFVVAGLLIAFATIPHNPRTEAVDRHPFTRVLLELKGGWDSLRGSSVLLLSFYELSLAVLVMFTMFALAPAYVSQILHIPEQDTYVILVPATLGALLGAWALGQFGRSLSKAWLLVVALVATGVTLGVLGAGPVAVRRLPELREQVRVFAAGLAFLLGLEFGALLIPALTYLMEHTPDAVRGRVFALLFMVVNGVTAVPVLLAAALSDTIGIDRVIAGLGALLVLTGLGIARFAARAFATTRS